MTTCGNGIHVQGVSGSGEQLFLEASENSPRKSSANDPDTPCTNPKKGTRTGLARERDVERKLAKAARERGGIAPKLACPGFDGMPDRIVLMPDGHVGFVEAKAPGRRPRPLQEARHRMLRELGFSVFVLDDEGQIGGILDEICAA